VTEGAGFVRILDVTAPGGILLKPISRRKEIEIDEENASP
jgi:hypothetical protein